MGDLGILGASELVWGFCVVLGGFWWAWGLGGSGRVWLGKSSQVWEGVGWLGLVWVGLGGRGVGGRWWAGLGEFGRVWRFWAGLVLLGGSGASGRVWAGLGKP